MSGRDDIGRAASALQFIPADISRDEWVRVGMAAQSAGLSFNEFDAWSVAGDSYNARDAADTWRSFQPGKGIGAGTLFKIAADYGWRDDGADVSNLLNKTAAKPRKDSPLPSAKPVDVEALWTRLEPAGEHAYIRAKSGVSDGLRVVPAGDPLTIAGQSIAGCLAVPCYSIDGELQSMQFIPPPGKGKKLNLPGASMAGASFVVGKISAAGTVYLVEGIGQAWACWKATGHAAFVCFGWGNVARIAASLRNKYNDARIIIVPDKGKESSATEIAGSIGALVACMPTDEENNFDCNDYAQREGFGALELLLKNASSPAKPEPRYKLLSGDDLDALPVMEWLIKNVVPARGIMQIFGASKAGKSFLAIDMGCAVAAGRDWFGYRVKPAPVTILALEGEAGIKNRIAAWKRHNGRDLPSNLSIILQPFRINDARDVSELASVLPRGGLLVVDTQNRAAPDVDENSSRDMGSIIEGAKALQTLTGGVVALVAHSGKDASKGVRGHSSQLAAMDASLEVTRNGDARSWRVEKSKDGEDSNEHPFVLQVIKLGNDSDGDLISSCVITQDDQTKPRRKVLTESQRQGMATYALACDDGQGLIDGDGSFSGLHLEEWRVKFYEISTADSAASKKKAFQRARNALQDEKFLTVKNDIYRITEPSISIREGNFIAATLQKNAPEGCDLAGQAGHFEVEKNNPNVPLNVPLNFDRVKN